MEKDTQVVFHTLKSERFELKVHTEASGSYYYYLLAE